MTFLKKYFTGVIGMALVIFLLMSATGIPEPKRASAQLGGGLNSSLFPPFGGRVDLFVPCTCLYDSFATSYNYLGAFAWIHVGDPRPGDFILGVPGLTRWYERYAPFLEHWILGVAWPFDWECKKQGPCAYGVCTCVPIKTAPLVKIFGSS